MYLRKNENVVKWAGEIINIELHGEFDEPSRRMTTTEVEQIARLMLLWVKLQEEQYTKIMGVDEIILKALERGDEDEAD